MFLGLLLEDCNIELLLLNIKFKELTTLVTKGHSHTAVGVLLRREPYLIQAELHDLLGNVHMCSVLQACMGMAACMLASGPTNVDSPKEPPDKMAKQ